ncbi:MAG: acetyl-CoA carboxylase biotin carboxyl carrier protein [Burkholderiaceae bacterium]|jgi:acetyl-CoA carboxylase biotin carboxyl carrier protein|nr:MAG: acetyl-CoA carboxylase biotin carboxyl carrier protein [Burkholderiaceae bacterium]
MDLRKLKTLVDLVSESDISELEITEAEGKVRIVKANPAVAAPAIAAAPMVLPVAAGAPIAQAAVPATPAAAAEGESGFVVKSPMVGTFYRSASADGNPLVEIGQKVKEGDVLCIIEAMKIMNEINAEKAGTVTQVLSENGDAVEYGQPLFVIE